MATFTINAAETGFLSNLDSSDWLSYNSVSTSGYPAGTWFGFAVGTMMRLNGTTTITGSYPDPAFFSMSVSSATFQIPVYDPFTGALLRWEAVGTGSFPTFSASGEGIRDHENNVFLGIGGEFSTFMESLNFRFNGSNAADFMEGGQLSGYGRTATFNGAGGNDLIYGSYSASNVIDGGSGDDQIEIVDGGVGSRINTVWGGAGNDFVNLFDSEGDSATIFGGSGNDTLLASNGGQHVIQGGAGNDVVQGDGTDRAVFSGKHTDYAISQMSQILVEDRRALSPDGTDTLLRIDRLTFSDGTFTLASRIGFGVTINGTANADTITPTATVAGQPFVSVLKDTLNGNAGNDTLDGGAGADTMYGGSGNDTYVVNGGGDRVIEMSSANGTDTVRASVTLTLSQFVENLTLTGTGAINGTGNTLANSLTGNSAANILTGFSGNDSLSGGGGNDTLDSGNNNDVLTGGAGGDMLYGGAGTDRFVFTFAADSSGATRDVIASSGTGSGFEGAGAAAGDRIDLAAIDANTGAAANQAFLFGGSGAGRLTLATSGTDTLVRGNTDADSAYEFELVIRDGAVLASAYSAADFVL